MCCRIHGTHALHVPSRLHVRLLSGFSAALIIAPRHGIYGFDEPSLLTAQALHVGDSLSSDIQGGINAGLGATVWISPTGATAPQEGPQPTYTIMHITELLPLLDQI